MLLMHRECKSNPNKANSLNSASFEKTLENKWYQSPDETWKLSEVEVAVIVEDHNKGKWASKETQMGVDIIQMQHN